MSGAASAGARLATIAAMAAAVFGLIRLFAHERAPADDGVRRMAAAWNGEIAFGAAYAALDPSREEGARAAPVFDPADDFGGLPRTPGFEDVAAHCSACHSLALVMQQRQNAAGWSAVIDRMITRQGMPEPDPATRAALTAYLAREYGRR